MRRLGSTRSELADICIVSASNEDLGTAVRQRRFREDLYHRLAVITLALPPLRERGTDVELLAQAALARTCAKYSGPAKQLGPDALAALRGYRWPGNVRELNSLIERAVLLSPTPSSPSPRSVWARRRRSSPTPPTVRPTWTSTSSSAGA